MTSTESLDNAADIDLSSLVWLPGEFAAAGLNDVKLAGSKGTKWMNINVPRLSGYFAPIRGGQMISILGQSSMGKSMLMHYMEHRMALQLLEEKRTNELIFHVSVEEPIEDMAMLALARHSGQPVGLLSRGSVSDQKGLEVAAATISGTPIVYIGESLNTNRKQDMTDSMNLTNCFRVIKDTCIQTNMIPAAIMIDYLQALPIDPRLANMTEPVNQRRLQVRADVYFMRRAAIYFKCPIFAGVQAKQTLSGAKKDNSGLNYPVIPGMYDGEESSSIAQRTDRMLSTWIPSRTYPVGTVVHLSPNDSFVVSEDQMLIKVVKQRGNLPAGKTYMFINDYNTGDMTPEDL